MANLPFDQRLAFDTELSLAASTFTGAAQFLGTLTNEPVMLLIKNQTSISVFFADNPGSTKGTTMAVGEEIILDCRANSGRATNMGFSINTSFYVTGAAGTGSFKVSVLYAT
jgi:hypothetical protein